MDSKYITSAAKANQLPEYKEPEIAFIGRSNTGKSTLLNTLLGRRNLARTSRTPGHTKMVNFFELNQRIILADLPGYGFHEAGYDQAKHWDELLQQYFRRPNITNMVFLLDIRRDVRDEDLVLMTMLSRQLPITVALTKADKINQAKCQQAKRKLKAILDQEKIRHDRIIPVSSLKKSGIEELKSHLFEAHLS